MKILLSILIGSFIVVGGLLSLIAIYASPDGKIHFLEASYFWVANAIAILGLVILLKNAETVQK